MASCKMLRNKACRSDPASYCKNTVIYYVTILIAAVFVNGSAMITSALYMLISVTPMS